MPTENFKRLEQYFDAEPSLAERYEELADVSRTPNLRTPEAMEKVICFVTKYLVDCLGITNTDIADIKQQIRSRILSAADTDRRFMQRGQDGNVYIQHSSDDFAFQCLADTQSTAQLAWEIIEGTRFNLPESLAGKGVDIGCGWGPLAAAVGIALRRKGAQSVEVKAFDIQDSCVETAKRVLQTLPDVFVVEKADCTESKLYEDINGWAREDGVSLWTSETISYQVPPATVTDSGVVWPVDFLSPAERDLLVHHIQQSQPSYQYTTDEALKADIAAYRPQSPDSQVGLIIDQLQQPAHVKNRFVDPYVTIVSRLIEHNEQFLASIKDSRVGFFPNVISGEYATGNDPTIHYNTIGQRLPLSSTGMLFSGYQGFAFNGGRWGSAS